MENRRRFDRTTIEPIEMVIEEIEILLSDRKYINIPIFIDEVSEHGVRFSSQIELPVDAGVRFNLPSLQVNAWLTGTIVWRRESSVAGFQYGLYVSES